MPDLPLRFASDEVFARTRELFVQSQFNEDTVEARCPNKDSAFSPYPDGEVPADADAAEILLGTFLRAGRCSKFQLTNTLGAQGFEDLLALGLIVASDEEDGYRGSVRIRPMYGMYVISDLWDVGQGPNQGLPDDVVFPPDIANTLSYLSYLPLTPCRTFLEACGGSGIAALVAAQRYANKAYSFDITQRSTVAATFSARLNGLADFEARCGDTYEPAGDMQFERIAAHPPYVPVLRHTWIYQAGGPDGEQITRKHVEGLPAVLAPGGRFYCRALGTDRIGENFEQRVRTWLGEHSEEFDVAILVLRVMDPFTSVMQAIVRKRSTVDELPLWEKQIDGLKIQRYLAMWLVVQRHAEKRPAFTVRRLRSKYTGPSELEWLLQWETARSQGITEDHLLSNPLQAAPVMHRTIRTIRNGQWEVASQHIRTEFPFECDWDIDDFGAYVLPLCDGKITGMQIYQSLREQGALGDVDTGRFASALADLVSGGFLRVKGYEPAAPRIHKDEEGG